MKSVLEKANKNTELLKLKICSDILYIARIRSAQSPIIDIKKYLVIPEQLSDNNLDKKEAISFNETHEKETIAFLNDLATGNLIPFFTNAITRELAKINVETIIDSNSKTIEFKINSDETTYLKTSSLELKRQDANGRM